MVILNRSPERSICSNSWWPCHVINPWVRLSSCSVTEIRYVPMLAMLGTCISSEWFKGYVPPQDCFYISCLIIGKTSQAGTKSLVRFPVKIYQVDCYLHFNIASPNLQSFLLIFGLDKSYEWNIIKNIYTYYRNAWGNVIRPFWNSPDLL